MSKLVWLELKESWEGADEEGRDETMVRQEFGFYSVSKQNSGWGN